MNVHTPSRVHKPCRRVGADARYVEAPGQQRLWNICTTWKHLRAARRSSDGDVGNRAGSSPKVLRRVSAVVGMPTASGSGPRRRAH